MNKKTTPDIPVRKKAILVNSITSGGAERVVLTLIDELKTKHDLTLICIGKDNFYDPPANINIIYLSKAKIKRGFTFYKFILLPFIFFRLRSIVYKNNFSIIQSHLIFSNYFNILLKLSGCKHRADIVNHAYIGYGTTFLARFNKLGIKLLYRHADNIISITRKMKHDLDKMLNDKKHNNHYVIPNPHDILKIQQLKNEEVNDFIYDKSKQYLIYVGELVLRKNIDLLIDCLYMLKNRSEIELILVGDGELKDKLINKSKKLLIQERVHFLGQKSNPFKYMVHSSVFVFSSNWEGLPNVLIEAIICGLPIISTDCLTGPREILAPGTDYNKKLIDSFEIGEYGILVPENNTQEFGKAIETDIRRW